jgi:hypothetical protein
MQEDLLHQHRAAFFHIEKGNSPAFLSHEDMHPQ